MELIPVNIQDQAGRNFKASLPDEMPVNRLIQQIITKLGLSFTNSTGRRLSYRLIHEESGLQLRDNNTLKEANVRPHDTLKLRADFVAGIYVMLNIANGADLLAVKGSNYAQRR